MKNILMLLRGAAVMLCVAMGAPASAATQVSIGISVPGVSIGINTPAYPQFVRVPNYPVYYAPQLQNNFFFYDGLYWVYEQDNWYSSGWYNGPWYEVPPQGVPLFVLRVPVRYYRHPPPYFRGWQPEAPPRWGEHWGNDWSRQRSGWDRWDRRTVPAPAPLPIYQRQYSGERYPRIEQQRDLQTRNYRYQARDAVVRQRQQEQAVPRAAAPVPEPSRPPVAARPQQAPQRPAAVADRQPPQQQRQQQQPEPRAERPEPRAPQANEQRAPPPGRADAPRPEPSQGQGRGKGNAKDKEKGQPPDRADGDEPGQPRKR